MGTITAVGSPASLETIWIFESGTTSVYLCLRLPARAALDFPAHGAVADLHSHVVDGLDLLVRRILEFLRHADARQESSVRLSALSAWISVAARPAMASEAKMGFNPRRKKHLTQSSRPGCAGVERPRNSTLVKQVLYFQSGNFKFPESRKAARENREFFFLCGFAALRLCGFAALRQMLLNFIVERNQSPLFKISLTHPPAIAYPPIDSTSKARSAHLVEYSELKKSDTPF